MTSEDWVILGVLASIFGIALILGRKSEGSGGDSGEI